MKTCRHFFILFGKVKHLLFWPSLIILAAVSSFTQAITISSLSLNCLSISYQESIDGSIGISGEQDCYTFQGSAGHRITAFLDNNMPGTQYASLQLLNPSGQEVQFCDFWYGDCSIEEYALLSSGTFSLIIDGRFDDTGDYTIVLNHLNDSTESIAYGQSLARDISPMGDRDTFLFQGTAGHRITAFLDNNMPGTQYASLQLLNPSGQEVQFCDFWYGDCSIEDYTLLSSGTFSLIVDGRFDDTGDYTIVLNHLNDSTESIAYGQSLARDISPMGDRDTFLFQGAAGHRITAFLDNNMPGTQYASLQLLNPSGQEVQFCDFWYGDCSIEDYALLSSGTFSLIIDGRFDDTGDYTIVLNHLNDSTESIAYGQSLARDISPMGDRDTFLFQGAAGHRITAFLDNNMPGTQYASLQLLNPSGQEVQFCDFWYGDCSIEDYTLLSSGTFSLIVDGRFDDTGDYTIVLNHLNDSTESIAYGQSLARDISPMGDRDTFLFQGAAGHRITAFLDNNMPGTQYASLQLLNPSGQEVQFCDFWYGDCSIEDYTLLSSGTFSLIVDGRFDDTGDYTIVLNHLNDSTESIAYGQSLARDISPMGDRDTFLFRGAAGHRITAFLDNNMPGTQYASLQLLMTLLVKKFNFAISGMVIALLKIIPFYLLVLFLSSLMVGLTILVITPFH